MHASNAPAPQRACLSVPGSDPGKLAKAGSLGADEVVVDLEDSVAPARKDAARENLRKLSGQVTVRVNATGTPWCHLDVIACAQSGAVRSIVVPKVESAGDLAFVDRLLDGAEAAAGGGTRIGVQALIETPAGLARLPEIAAASRRLEALILGYADLNASLGRPAESTDVPDIWIPAQHAVLVAARTHGLAAIDGPYLRVEDDESFRASARHARAFGFDGKWAIHPRQLAFLVETFTPAPAEVDHARAVLAALDGSGGVAALDGQMLDEAIAVSARSVLARAGEVRA
jgi:citrate lyase subunit beta/citryl-CoA lyase